MYRIVLLLLCCFCFVHGSTNENLYRYLMRFYVKDVKPDGKVLMQHSITPRRIINYDDGTLTADVWISQKWNDNRLQWDPSEWQQKEVLRIPSNRLWKPDVVLFNNAGSDSGMIYDNLNAVVRYNGSVLWVPVMRLTSQCQQQGWRKAICQWKFGSWTYNADEIDFINGTQSINMYDFQPNSEFDVKGVNATKNKIVYSCCPEAYADVTYTLELETKVLN